MAIAFANSGSGGINTSGTGFTGASAVDITAAAVGDWVYCGIFNAANEASITFTGWTQILSGDQGTTSHYSLWRRQKQSGDTTFDASWPTSQKATWIWVSYSGLDGTTPDELAAEASAASATQTTPSLTPNSNDRWSLCFFYVRSTTSAPLAFGSYTSPLGARVDALPQSTSRWVRAAAADTAGAVTQAAHQYSATSTNGSQGGAILLFLIPAAGGDATVIAVMATATADALVPTVTGDATVAAIQADATADALVPAATGDAAIMADIAAATADALTPAVSGDATVIADMAAATADALAPAVSGGAGGDATVTVPTPAAATADALPPTVAADAAVLAVLADATAATLLPLIGGDATVIAPMAMATADVNAPAVTIPSAAPIIPADGVVIPVDIATGTVQPTTHDSGAAPLADQASGTVQPADQASGTVRVTDQATGSVRLQ